MKLLKKIKGIDADNEVIIVTGHGDIDSTITALQYGASDFINKPVRDEALAIALGPGQGQNSDPRAVGRIYPRILRLRWPRPQRKSDAGPTFQKLLIHASNDAIVAFDHNWMIVVYNPAAAPDFSTCRPKTSSIK